MLQVNELTESEVGHWLEIELAYPISIQFARLSVEPLKVFEDFSYLCDVEVIEVFRERVCECADDVNVVVEYTVLTFQLSQLNELLKTDLVPPLW
jgi:hypothetical protein